MADHTVEPDHSQERHSAPDYELEPALQFEDADQYKALFEPTRLQICDLLLERAATIKELSETLDKPKGTVGHHVAALEEAGLIRVVRTKKVRAIEAKYYGRVARTFLLGGKPGDEEVGIDLAPGHFLQEAMAEYGTVADDETGLPGSTLRYARIPTDRAAEWAQRLFELTEEFTSEPRGGDTTYGLLVAFYPTERPHLPDES